MKNFTRLFGIIAILAVIVFSVVSCDNGTTSRPTIKITDVPSNWSGTIGVYIFSEFKTSGRPDFVAGGTYAFSGGVINADLSPFTGSGMYYITIQPTNSTVDGYAYFGSGSSPVKSNISEAPTTLSFNGFKKYNIWR